MHKPCFALSLKQPWAALLAGGYKSIEVRRWPTSRRGPILLHAARVPDSRPEAWQQVPKVCQELARRRGGIIGMAELTDCIRYDDAGAFRRDYPKHRNDPSWFQAPVLFGFVFANCHPLPFSPCAGWFRFFRVDDIHVDRAREF
jgi:hypothetical protein